MDVLTTGLMTKSVTLPVKSQNVSMMETTASVLRAVLMSGLMMVFVTLNVKSMNVNKMEVTV